MLASAWYGLMLPAGAPPEVVTRLNTEVNRLLRQPEIANKLLSMGAFVMGGSSQEFARFVQTEIKRYEGIVRDSGAPKE
jgi:tripartite-type tricarboxylate transporter receptor subunit TctC